MNVNPSTKNVPSYRSARRDLAQLVPTEARSILDVGCNEGALGEYLKSMAEPDSRYVMGLDINPEAVVVAKKRLDSAQVVNLNQDISIERLVQNKMFDVIIFGDVLEHLMAPWDIISTFSNHLNRDGMLIVSIPNTGRWELIWYVLRQTFPMNARGVFDNTHLRFFMYHDINRLVPSDMKIVYLTRRFRLFDAFKTRLDYRFGKLIQYIPWLREFWVHQYVYTIRYKDMISTRISS